MSLEIIGAGYGRTGTLSLKVALEKLGYSCYHMEEVLNTKKNKGHLDFWAKVSQSDSGVQHDWERVFSDFTATVDNPGACVYPELIQAYPNAKVILSLHPKGPEAWYRSTVNTIYFFGSAWEGDVLAFCIPFFRKFNKMAQRLIWDRSHRGTIDKKEDAIQRYKDHIDEVKNAVPESNLLIYSVDQGWEPLCKFLDKSIPDSEFPRVNDTKDFQKKIRIFKGLAYFIIIIAAVILFLLYKVLV